MANLHFLVLYIKRTSIFVFLGFVPFSFFVLCLPFSYISFFYFLYSLFPFFVYRIPFFSVISFSFVYYFSFLLFPFSIFFICYFFSFLSFYYTVFHFPFFLFNFSCKCIFFLFLFCLFLSLIRSMVIIVTTYGSQGTPGYNSLTLRLSVPFCHGFGRGRHIFGLLSGQEKHMEKSLPCDRHVFVL